MSEVPLSLTSRLAVSYERGTLVLGSQESACSSRAARPWTTPFFWIPMFYSPRNTPRLRGGAPPCSVPRMYPEYSRSNGAYPAYSRSNGAYPQYSRSNQAYPAYNRSNGPAHCRLEGNRERGEPEALPLVGAESPCSSLKSHRSQSHRSLKVAALSKVAAASTVSAPAQNVLS
ncbi:hypothetical protein T484DRAFT_3518296 [Baffinella frigidus]|nr:hypothetical protein T484DRAFT_3518296 [Cryptophyta sp. CCMP2293]